MPHWDPSITYLELYAMTAGILVWIERFCNLRIILFCDNESAMNILNNNSSNCKNCMVLIRLIVMKCLIHNVRIYCRQIESAKNSVADSLSRHQMSRFARLTTCLSGDSSIPLSFNLIESHLCGKTVLRFSVLIWLIQASSPPL